MTPSLLSINVGHPERVGNGLSGINKQRVVSARLTTEGVEGDAILNRNHHGGPDQAVYIYFQHDYDFWERELGRWLRPGLFGENLTITGIDATDIAVGDRFRIGEALLEVTYHRTPCGTFGAQMGEPSWVKRFQQARRPGAYARVLNEGTVQTGDAVHYTPFDGTKVRVSALMALDGVREIDVETLRWALSAPIREKTRAKYEALLAGIA
jgi:MOSC domain-containing protein YiiM